MILLENNSKASNLKTQILLNYSNKETARAVLRAICPDNFKTPRDLLVNSTCEGGTVATTIELESNMPRLIATIDDILSCASVAEKTVAIIKKFK